MDSFPHNSHPSPPVVLILNILEQAVVWTLKEVQKIVPKFHA
jgi:hypothetical protein